MRTLLAKCTLALIFFTACSTSTKRGTSFQEAPSKSTMALLYIYRAANDWGTARTPTMIVDENSTFDTLHKGYRFFYLTPGEHTVKVKGGDMGSPSIKFAVQKGKTYYLKYDLKGNSSGAGLGFGLIGALLESAMTPKGPSDEKKTILEDGVAIGEFNEHLYFVKQEPAKKELADTSLIVDKTVATESDSKNQHRMYPLKNLSDSTLGKTLPWEG